MVPTSQLITVVEGADLVVVVEVMGCHHSTSVEKVMLRLSDLGGGCTANYGSSARPLRYSVNLSVYVIKMVSCFCAVWSSCSVGEEC